VPFYPDLKDRFGVYIWRWTGIGLRPSLKRIAKQGLLEKHLVDLDVKKKPVRRSPNV